MESNLTLLNLWEGEDFWQPGALIQLGITSGFPDYGFPGSSGHFKHVF